MYQSPNPVSWEVSSYVRASSSHSADLVTLDRYLCIQVTLCSLHLQLQPGTVSSRHLSEVRLRLFRRGG